MAVKTPEQAVTVRHHPDEYRVIGTRPVRHDGVDKVTGAALYGADVSLPGQLYAQVVRSPHAHALIKRIDTSKVEALDGVQAVITSADFAEPGDKRTVDGTPLKYRSANVMACGKALYHGHAVAAVAATSPHLAAEAAKLVEVDYAVLPHVMDVREAMKPDAPLLIGGLLTEQSGKPITDTPSNIAEYLLFEAGDTEKGFAEADVVVEREYTCEMVHQGYIETHAASAQWHADENVTVWCSTQGAFSVREEIADLLDHPISKVKVIPTEIGGGFGGKTTVYLEPVATLLSRKTGRPVKVAMDREEVLTGTGPTPGGYMRIKIGATKDGRITAGDACLAFEAGGFPGSVISAGCKCVFGPYDLPNARVQGYDVVVNKPKTHAYRAPGATQAGYAAEGVVDELCRELGMDPIDFRMKNSAKEGSWRVDDPPYPRIGHEECLEAARASDHWQTQLESENGKLRGRGIASGFWFNVGLTSSAIARLNPDGRVTLLEGSTDIGGTRTSVAMQFAETLGIPVEEVVPIVADTDSIGRTDVTGGSRVTFATGYAAHEAAKDLQAQMTEGLADVWDVAAESIAYADGSFSANGNSVTFKEAAALLDDEDVQAVGRATVTPDRAGSAFAVHIADVEVDPDTGKVKVLRYTAVQDAGVAIYPPYVEGQMQGGAAQGIGWAFNEEYVYDASGRMLNATLLDYRMPTTLDVPMIETVIVEVPNPGHPFGVRGVGEVPIVPPPAALGHAVFDAIGQRLYALPMSPHRVQTAISASAGGDSST